jgi:hypothetical protein
MTMMTMTMTMTRRLVPDCTGCAHDLSGPMDHIEGRGAIQCRVCVYFVVQVLDSFGCLTGLRQVIHMVEAGAA